MRDQTVTITMADMKQILPASLTGRLDQEAQRLQQAVVDLLNYASDVRMDYYQNRVSLASLDTEDLEKKIFEYQLQEESLLNGVCGMKIRHGKENESILHYIRKKADRRLIEDNERDILRRVRNKYFLESGTGPDQDRNERGSRPGRGRRDSSYGFYWPEQFEIAGMQTDRRDLGKTLLYGYLAYGVGHGTRILRAAAARFGLCEAERMLELYDSVGFSTPAHIPDLFPEARKRKRHFIIHVGGTNTGKTHDAMEMLAKAPSGVYLCPLRMLAYEGREVIRRYGVPCSFATGEEKELEPGAKHVSETIGMLDYSRH
ncbi:MAG: hypothetical protein II640_08410, partial [Lachnospiraceae bacterium]|nr:hypothetical protein [Lachnospiraceae bacterium]